MPGPKIDDALKSTGAVKGAIVVGAGDKNRGLCAELLRDVDPGEGKALAEGVDIRTLRPAITPAHDGRHDLNTNMLRVADPRDRLLGGE